MSVQSNEENIKNLFEFAYKLKEFTKNTCESVCRKIEDAQRQQKQTNDVQAAHAEMLIRQNKSLMQTTEEHAKRLECLEETNKLQEKQLKQIEYDFVVLKTLFESQQQQISLLTQQNKDLQDGKNTGYEVVEVMETSENPETLGNGELEKGELDHLINEFPPKEDALEFDELFGTGPEYEASISEPEKRKHAGNQKKNPRTRKKMKRSQHSKYTPLSDSHSLPPDKICEILKENPNARLMVATGEYCSVFASKFLGYMHVESPAGPKICRQWRDVDIMAIMDTNDECKQILKAAGPFGVGIKVEQRGNSCEEGVVNAPQKLENSVKNKSLKESKKSAEESLLYTIPLKGDNYYTLILIDTQSEFGNPTETHGELGSHVWVFQRQTPTYVSTLSSAIEKKKPPKAFDTLYSHVLKSKESCLDKWARFHLIAYMFDLNPITALSGKIRLKQSDQQYSTDSMTIKFKDELSSIINVIDSLSKGLQKKCNARRVLKCLVRQEAVKSTDMIRPVNSKLLHIFDTYICNKHSNA